MRKRRVWLFISYPCPPPFFWLLPARSKITILLQLLNWTRERVDLSSTLRDRVRARSSPWNNSTGATATHQAACKLSSLRTFPNLGAWNTCFFRTKLMNWNLWSVLQFFPLTSLSSPKLTDGNVFIDNSVKKPGKISYGAKPELHRTTWKWRGPTPT